MKIVVSLLVVVLLGAAALHGCEPSRVLLCMRGGDRMRGNARGIIKTARKITYFCSRMG